MPILRSIAVAYLTLVGRSVIFVNGNGFRRITAFNGCDSAWTLTSLGRILGCTRARAAHPDSCVLSKALSLVSQSASLLMVSLRDFGIGNARVHCSKAFLLCSRWIGLTFFMPNSPCESFLHLLNALGCLSC